VLRTLPDKSVQCVVTSPPYWGLRDYGIEGQLGLEPTPDAYVANMIAVLAEVWRVLKDDGTVWVNLGDSYARVPEKGGSETFNGRNGYGEGYDDAQRQRRESQGSSDGAIGRGDRAAIRIGANGVKPKDLVGIPWRVAFALQAAGWYLRSDIIWAKPNPMPESVTDRPTKAHEYIFLLAKRQRYYFDQDAVREPYIGPLHSPGNKTDNGRLTSSMGHLEEPDRTWGNPLGRNIRSVWTVATQPFKGAHFATFPIKLITPCILAGSRPDDTVLDPFSGAATTGVVALLTGRKYIGIELNEKYVIDIAIPRIYAQQAKLK
jgi:DNA modification methylase